LMGVRFERRTIGARGGLGLLYSLGAENGSPCRMGNHIDCRNGSSRGSRASASTRPS
jgi:hypothetical protein